MTERAVVTAVAAQYRTPAERRELRRQGDGAQVRPLQRQRLQRERGADTRGRD